MTLQAAPALTQTAQGQLGAQHGYRFDGDLVHLNAEVCYATSPAESGRAWALQLWACAPTFAGSRPDGVRVAELPLAPVDGAAGTIISVAGTSPALPPALSGDHAMVLALVSGNGDGEFDTLHDMDIYPQTQAFVQPRMRGDVACRLGDATVELSVEAIENPRPADNLSGTLALEVWSLDAPWNATEWTGVPVASVVLGTLAGQCEWSGCRFDAPAATPSAPGYLVVMLREWGPAGYVTRDCRTLAEPAVAVVEAVAPPPAAKPAVAAKAAGRGAAKPTAKAEAKVVEAVAAKAAVKPVAKSAKVAGVSINDASEAELAALKGLGVAAARAIIAARPYASLDELCRAKGIGTKLLAKLRQQLSL